MGRAALDDLDAGIGAEDGGAVVVAPAGEGHEVVRGEGCVLGIEGDPHDAFAGVEHGDVGLTGIDAHRLGTVEVDGARRRAVFGGAVSGSDRAVESVVPVRRCAVPVPVVFGGFGGVVEVRRVGLVAAQRHESDHQQDHEHGDADEDDEPLPLHVLLDSGQFHAGTLPVGPLTFTLLGAHGVPR